jgi:deazaflavin-dependent oxidoreductase (nitroreductase family)
MNADLQQLADKDFCYLTTTGRNSGRPHTIEIWFALAGHTVYMLSGGRDKADWVQNVMRHREVQLRIADAVFSGQARFVSNTEEDALARKIVYDKYTPRDSDDLSHWSRTSLPVAVDVVV